MSMVYETKDGDPAIYSGSGIEKPANAGLPKVPFYKDDRGSINFINVNGNKVNLLYTKKDFMRSGDVHKNTQFDAIVSGKVKLMTLENKEIVKTILDAGSLIIIKPHVPHLFKFLEDTVMVEWWDGPFEAWYYKKFRNLIKEQLRK